MGQGNGWWLLAGPPALCITTCVSINCSSQPHTCGSGCRGGNASVWAHSHQGGHCQYQRATHKAARLEQHPTIQVVNILIGCHPFFLSANTQVTVYSVYKLLMGFSRTSLPGTYEASRKWNSQSGRGLRWSKLYHVYNYMQHARHNPRSLHSMDFPGFTRLCQKIMLKHNWLQSCKHVIETIELHILIPFITVSTCNLDHLSLISYIKHELLYSTLLFS